MTSVDSGVETGNDSNDSAQTENNQSNNQTFNDVAKIMSSTVNLDKQFVLTSNHKQQLESTAVQADLESLASATTTIDCHSDNLHSLLSRNTSGVVALSEPLVNLISNDSPSSEVNSIIFIIIFISINKYYLFDDYDDDDNNNNNTLFICRNYNLECHQILGLHQSHYEKVKITIKLISVIIK